MTHTLFETALSAAKAIVQTTPSLRDFVDCPKTIAFTAPAPHLAPVIDELQNYPGAATALTLPLQQAWLALSKLIEWHLTYSEPEASKGFLQCFGWFELVGLRDGCFHTNSTQMMVGYWGANLYYSRRQLFCLRKTEGTKWTH